jgi:hypothetical protein
MSEDTLQRISQEMSRQLGQTLQPQDGLLVLADENEQLQVSIEVGALDGMLYLISPIVGLPPDAMVWPEPDDQEAWQTLLAHAAVSRLMLVLNGDIQAHASCSVALDAGSGQLLMIERLPASLSGQDVLARIEAAGQHMARLRAAVRQLLKPINSTGGPH